MAVRSAKAGRGRIADILEAEAGPRDKRALVARFLDKEFGLIPPGEDPRPRFRAFWTRERRAALDALVQSEGPHPDRVGALLSDRAFTGRKPLRDTQ